MRAVGIAFKISRRGKLLRSILEFLNKFISYAEGAPIPTLKALSERQGNRFQNFSVRKIFARDFRISKINSFRTPKGAKPNP